MNAELSNADPNYYYIHNPTEDIVWKHFLQISLIGDSINYRNGRETTRYELTPENLMKLYEEIIK